MTTATVTVLPSLKKRTQRTAAKKAAGFGGYLLLAALAGLIVAGAIHASVERETGAGVCDPVTSAAGK
jgi:hypothetical protein